MELRGDTFPLGARSPGATSFVLELPLYGFDIETDTRVDGLDPARSSVIAAAVCAHDFEQVFIGDEARLLSDLDAFLESLAPGIVVTWNGSHFDFPFLAYRARFSDLRIGLIPARQAGGGGEQLSRSATWYGHAHLDAMTAYRSELGGTGRSCKLKSVAHEAGLDPVVRDPAQVHTLSEAELGEYVASDARTTRLLAEARWDLMENFVGRT